MTRLKPIHVFLSLSLLYLLYSFDIYLKPMTSSAYEIPAHLDPIKIAEGRLVWQKYNCENCHQLYGLGGHLGPDLTNEYSKLHQNEAVLRVLIKGGFSQMPRLHLSEAEEDALIEFLKAVDESGSGDPSTLIKMYNGMTEQPHGK